MKKTVQRTTTKPDYDRWAMVPYWSADQAAALALGFDPERIASLEDEQLESLQGLRNVITLAQEQNVLPKFIRPDVFVAFMNLTHVGAPFKLAKAISKIDPSENYLAIKADYDRVKAENEHLKLELKRLKPLHTKERITLLKMTFGMAKCYYGYDPLKSRSKVVPEICNDLRTGANIDLTDDTVRTWLNNAAEEVSQ